MRAISVWGRLCCSRSYRFQSFHLTRFDASKCAALRWKREMCNAAKVYCGRTLYDAVSYVVGWERLTPMNHTRPAYDNRRLGFGPALGKSFNNKTFKRNNKGGKFMAAKMSGKRFIWGNGKFTVISPASQPADPKMVACALERGVATNDTISLDMHENR